MDWSIGAIIICHWMAKESSRGPYVRETSTSGPTSQTEGLPSCSAIEFYYGTVEMDVPVTHTIELILFSSG